MPDSEWSVLRGVEHQRYEFCSNCGGHFHDSDPALPPADFEHLPSTLWGDRRRMNYNNVHVTGVAIQRFLMHTRSI